jgi:hypothetical protein
MGVHTFSRKKIFRSYLNILGACRVLRISIPRAKKY